VWSVSDLEIEYPLLAGTETEIITETGIETETEVEIETTPTETASAVEITIASVIDIVKEETGTVLGEMELQEALPAAPRQAALQ